MTLSFQRKDKKKLVQTICGCENPDLCCIIFRSCVYPFCSVFKEAVEGRGDGEDLDSIMTTVRRKMALEFDSRGGSSFVAGIPECTTRLTKRLVFPPVKAVGKRRGGAAR